MKKDPDSADSYSLGASLVNIWRVLPSAALLAGSITLGAALLQWFWAGWSVYAGAGPAPAVRWLLTGTIGAALLLPLGAALAGAAAGRRFGDSGLRDQARVTPVGSRQLAWRAGVGAVAPSLLAALVCAAFCGVVSLEDRYGSHAASAGAGLPKPAAVLVAYVLAALIAVAFGLWGAALAVKRSSPEARGWAEWRRSGLWSVAALLVIGAGPALIGPVLPHLSRPECALDAVLTVNPVTAVGAALGMDVLRSPRLYMLTRAPEYWYTYPPAVVVGAIYLLGAVWGGYVLRRGLEGE